MGVGDATEVLWAARSGPSRAAERASVLTGIDISSIETATSAEVVLSSLARAVLDSMSHLDRILTSTQRTAAETCVHSVRGPIAWSETMTARANALGNDDVFVCLRSERSFDTPGNRLIAVCLERIAGTVTDAPEISDVFNDANGRDLAERTGTARGWLDLAVMSKIARKPLSVRERTRLRSGRRGKDLAPFLDLVARFDDGPSGGLLARMTDRSTRAFHRFVIEMLGLVDQVEELPKEMKLVRGVLAVGNMTFRHPMVPGPGVPGLAYRGIPLLPPKVISEGAPWEGELPARGERISSPDDVRNVMKALGIRS